MDFNNFYSRLASKIELMEGSHKESDLNVTLPRTTTNSITLANILKKVEKSYEKGNKLLVGRINRLKKSKNKC